MEVCILLRKLERLDKDEFSEDERADAEEVRYYAIYFINVSTNELSSSNNKDCRKTILARTDGY